MSHLAVRRRRCGSSVLSRDAIARLRAIFPTGVCDWSRRGVGYRPVVTWPSFGPAPENLIFDITNPNRHNDDGEDD